MTIKFTKSITTKLTVAFLIAAVVPSSIALVALSSHLESEATEDARSYLESAVFDRETLLVEHVRALESAAAALANSEPTRDYLVSLAGETLDGDAPRNRKLADTAEDIFRSTQEQLWGRTHHVFLIDRAGTVVLSPPGGAYERPLAASGMASPAMRPNPGSHYGDSLAHEDFFQESLKHAYVTSFSSFEERDHFHQLILHPVQSSTGEALGVVAVEVAIDAITAILSDGLDVGRSGRVTFATLDGTRVVHAKSEFGERIDSEGLRQALVSEQPTHGRYTVRGDEDVFGFYLPSVLYPWVLCIEIDSDEGLASVANMRRFMWRALGLTALVLSLAGVGIGLWFGRPLRGCAAAALRVSSGDLEHPILVTRGEDEIGNVERAMESMRSRLLTQIYTLDDRVAGKTAELQAALEQAQLSEERFEQAVRGSRDGLWDWDLITDKVYCAPRWAEMLGYAEDEVGDTPGAWMGHVALSDRGRFDAALQQHFDGRTEYLDVEIRMTHADGAKRWMLCRGLAKRDASGRAVRVAGSLSDMTEAKRLSEDLHHQAHHDRLTGLPNRAVFVEQVGAAMGRSKRNRSRTYSVLFFDFDRFKVINDSLGHDAGDAVLIQIADRFRTRLRDGDVASRFGGDEFVVLLSDVADLTEAEDAATRWLAVFSEPFEINGLKVTSTASIGLVTGTVGHESPEDVIRDADSAMYEAKAAGKAQYCVFDAAMHEGALQRLRLEQSLRSADMKSEFALSYQPIVALSSEEIVGFEALIRWEHPELGSISPAAFLPIAEETGLIIPIGEWVLRQACAQLVEWEANFGKDRGLYVNVNISSKQIAHPGLPDTLSEMRGEYDFADGCVRLEVAESTVMDGRHDMLDAMTEVRECGFPLAMDHFGTGNSSLSSPHTFPLDILKIDKSFVGGMDENPDFSAVVQTIVNLARHLELDVIVEGIENPAQLAQLVVMDCEYVQGYLFSGPVSAVQATDLLENGLTHKGAA